MTIGRLVRLLCLTALTVVWANAQPDDNIGGHIVWERDFPKFSSLLGTSAAVGAEGDLWIVARERRSERLIRISPTGKLITAGDLSQTFALVPPADMVYFHLAISSFGQLAILAHYLHGGRVGYFDGAKFALIGKDGTISASKSVAGPGPEYKRFLALRDDHFLVMGDQSPMIVIKISSTGDQSWRRTFPSSWVLPLGRGA